MYSAGTHVNKPGMGTTIRQPATAQLLIDSLDRFPNGYPNDVNQANALSSSDWSLNLNQIVLNGYVTRLAVSQINFQWNLPTIIQFYNDEFILNFDGTDYNISLAANPGWYTIPEMEAYLQASIQAADAALAAVTVVWDFLNGCWEIDLGVGHTGFILPPDDPAANIPPVVARRCQHTLGLLAGGTPTRFIRGTVPTMLPTRYVDICSTYLTKYQRLKDANTLPSNITSTAIARVFAVPIGTAAYYKTETALTDSQSPGDAPFVITLDYTFPKQIAWNPDEAISNFDIQLRDEDGELVPYSTQVQLYPPVPPTAGSRRIMCEYSIVMLASED